jgi:hypothetical protein
MEDFVRRAIFASSVALLCLIMAPTAAAEQSTATGLRLDTTSFTTDRLPPRGDASAILADLEYEDAQTPRLFQADINGDAAVDYIVEAAPSLCGNGGCPYAVVDGRSIEHLGTFFGSLLILLDQKINHFPIAQSYSPNGAGRGTFTTYVFDSQDYQVVSLVDLSGASLEVLLKKLGTFRKLEPRKKSR